MQAIEIFWKVWRSAGKWLASTPMAAGARRGRPDAREEGAWRRDPLAHPALLAMDQRELGDLPLAATRPMSRC